MARYFSLLIKPAGPDCNVNCDYCFYRCKKSLFGDKPCRMSDEVLETLVRDYLALGFPLNHFAFQGGEPTLMGLDFYQRFTDAQARYAATGQIVTNALQTNGILLDDAWCEFLASNGFLVGISLDGPQDLHDAYRKDYAGNGTFARVMAAIDRCRAHSADFNILVLLNNLNVAQPDRLWEFFVAQDFRYLQFIPCAERSADDPNQLAPYSIAAEQYGAFLCRIFDLWVEEIPNLRSVRIFDSILQNLAELPASECTFGRECLDYIVIEHNGDAYCCDFYVQPDCYLGNIAQTPIGQLAESPVRRQFAERKRQLTAKCLVCRHLRLCRGGCPKDRAVLSGSFGALNYFCPAYKMLFDHILPRAQHLLQFLLS